MRKESIAEHIQVGATQGDTLSGSDAIDKEAGEAIGEAGLHLVTEKISFRDGKSSVIVFP